MSSEKVNKSPSQRLSIFMLVLIYIFFAFIGLYISFYPTINSKFTLLQRDRGDPVANNYLLEHSYRFFFDNNYTKKFWSPQFYYPEQNALSYSDNLIGFELGYSIFRPFFAPDTSFQLWMMLCLVLNYSFFALMLRKFGLSHWTAIFGGFLFAFSLPRIMQLSHSQLLPQFYTPLCLIFVWSFYKKPNFRDLLFVFSFIYLQILAGIYLGWFLIFSLLIFIIFLFIFNRGVLVRAIKFLRAKIFLVLAVVASFIAMIFMFIYPYLQTMKQLGGRSYYEVSLMIPRLKSWIATDGTTIWGKPLAKLTAGLPMYSEHLIFIGFALIILSFLAAYYFFSRQRKNKDPLIILGKACLIVFILIFILSLKIPRTDFSLWKIIYQYFPGASSIRAVSRVALISYFYLIIADMIFLELVLLRHITGKIIFVFLFILIGLIITIEQISFKLPAFDKLDQRQRVSELSTLIDNQNCDISYYVYGADKDPMVEQLLMVWAGINSNIKVINGYSGQIPKGYKQEPESMKLSEVIGWLEGKGVNISEAKLCLIFDKTVFPSLVSEGYHVNQLAENGKFILYQVK